MSTYGIDASSANKEQRTGVEWYAFHLIQHMKIHALAPGDRVYLYSPTPLKGELAALPDGWESRVLNWPPKRGWMSLRVGWEMLKRRPDVLFVPSQGLPWFTPNRSGKRGASVTTIHDIGFRRLPQIYDNRTRRRLEHETARAIHRAKKIFVVSEFTKREVMEIYKVTADRLVVTPLAADTDTFKKLDAQTTETVLQKHRLGRHFFLYVGRLEGKKNVTTLIRAFEQFKERRGIGDPFELVLIGKPGFDFADIKRFLDLSSQKEHIRPLGYVSEPETVAIMNAATALTFPSWYEGFGIPNLEAMACSTPLITSDIPPHREVAGEAALFVSPTEPEAWVEAMRRMADDAAIRDSLIAKGHERVAQFSWETTARLTWETMQGLVS